MVGAPERRPYGSWPSPISARSLVKGVNRVTEVAVDGDHVYWAESRPDEGGRVAIMRRAVVVDDAPIDDAPMERRGVVVDDAPIERRGVVVDDAPIEEASPPGVNVRTMVHEYGGGAWWVANGWLYFVDFADQRLQRCRPGDDAGEYLTPEPPAPRAWRYADGRVTPDDEWFICVREVHHQVPGGGAVLEPDNQLVAIALDGSREVRELVLGADFYAAPRPSPDGGLLAWIQWSHPNMPWDGTELWVGELRDGAVTAGRPVAGGPDEAIVQPEWSQASDLYFLSDRSGRSNLYRLTEDGAAVELGGDFDIGGPMWVFGLSRYAPDGSGGVVAALSRPQGDVLVQDSTSSAFSGWSSLEAVRVTADGTPVYIGATHRDEPAVVVHRGEPTYVSLPAVHGIAPGFLPDPEPITFATSGGAEAHALYYAPANPAITGPDDDRPPLLVLAHSGPTSAARRQLQLALRYWTSRGWAVVDVDYRGSTGYGRDYMRALDGQWGIADVEDCIAAATYLAERGDVDPDRLAIKGGSAGGFTVLAALTFHDVFAAGASRYGIGDLETLVRDTHKFESRYCDRLIGPYPEAKDRYVERSPIHHTERLTSPMIVLQGLQDAVVPPNQAEQMIEALAANGVPHAYLTFGDEGHGFRAAPTIVAALEAEYAFFAQIFGFEPADALPAVQIHGPSH